MPDNDRSIAPTAVANASQQATFLQTRYPDAGPDTMIVPQEVAIPTSNGEQQVMKYRTPY